MMGMMMGRGMMGPGMMKYGIGGENMMGHGMMGTGSSVGYWLIGLVWFAAAAFVFSAIFWLTHNWLVKGKKR